MTFRIAIVATACEFPEGRTPEELWETVLYGRRCFRRIPPERLDLGEYTDVRSEPDSIHSIEAALLENYQFDREHFRIPKSSFDQTDMSHWLALDVASRAWSSLDSKSLASERDTTAVIVANTLTGEFSRANLMRYRWPYVESIVRSIAADHLDKFALEKLIQSLETEYKAPFPPPDEDSLAGGLSNTIAGRIANFHGLRGGAHTVDGACASSLVAVVTAFERLAVGDIGCAIVGAVDLSLDPFELVGFSRNGALSRSLMRVFDEKSDGFWPGEGCGFLVLAREDVVNRHGWPVLAWLRGAAMSTDGEGALTRPTSIGQTLAAERAWSRAGLNPVNADYFEAHGTGTPTGDPIELTGLANMLCQQPRRPIAIGSIKANIGHTKAAAGLAGMLKAISICRERVIPATTGCIDPHPVLNTNVGQMINRKIEPTLITHGLPVTVGVNSFGFGGVNCHVVLQGADTDIDAIHHEPINSLPGPDWSALAGELFTLQASTRETLFEQLTRLERRAATLSHAQVVDLALNLTPLDDPNWRVCIVAATPQELGTAATEAKASLIAHSEKSMHIGAAFSWSAPLERTPRIAFLFPGQGISLTMRPSVWATRFPNLTDSVRRVEDLLTQDCADTAVMQPLLAEVSIAGLIFLSSMDISPNVVLGHSFGELPALLAAGCFESDQLRELAHARGKCMSDFAPPGAMLAIQAPREVVLAFAAAHEVDLACDNGVNRFVLAGDAVRIAEIARACAISGIATAILPTNRAFHSRDMSAASAAFADRLDALPWKSAKVNMVSSVTGRRLEKSDGLVKLLANQLVKPVLFGDALAALGEMDLVIEVGASSALVGMVDEVYPGRTMSLGMFSKTLVPTLLTIGSVWARGGRINRQALFEGRLVRPCSLDDEPVFLSNPCGFYKTSGGLMAKLLSASISTGSVAKANVVASNPESTLDTVRAIVADATGLALNSLNGRLRLLSDIHLNSIRSRHVISLTARRLGLAQLPFDLARLANASLEEVASYLDELRLHVSGTEDVLPPSLAPWVRLFSHDWMPSDPPSPIASVWRRSVILDDALAPIDALTKALLHAEGLNLATCAILILPTKGSPEVVEALLRVLKSLHESSEITGILLLQGSQLANGFLRSVSAELPNRRICVVEYDSITPESMLLAIAEYESFAFGYSELRLRGSLCERRSIVPTDLQNSQPGWNPSDHDVIVITGGASGIGAATARALAKKWSCRLAIVGRKPLKAPEVVEAMSLLQEVCICAEYFCADLADQDQARTTINLIEERLGSVTAIIHAAGINRPMSIRVLDMEETLSTLASKVTVLENLLQFLPVGQLRLVVGFGSIIGELGLTGEAHYALANEWLNRLLERHAATTSKCIVLPICWSAWREIGMATHIEGVLDGLERTGTRAMDTDEAIGVLHRLLQFPPTRPVVVSSRYGRSIEPILDIRLLQKYRYLERPRVFYPGVELVADAEICSDSDRYLQDHAPSSVLVFPLVCAIEAMTSAMQCLCITQEFRMIFDLKVGEAISCALGQRFILRTSALVQDDGSVAVELRSETTGFGVIHFSARFSSVPKQLENLVLDVRGEEALRAADIVYQGLCFHGRRFQLLESFSSISSTHVQARTRPMGAIDWYGPFLAPLFAAGNPAIRDSVIHALQVCVPQQTVLPLSVGRIQLGQLDACDSYMVRAEQVFSDGKRYVFNVDVFTDEGVVIERWHALELVHLTAPQNQHLSFSPDLLESLFVRIASDVMAAKDFGIGVVFDDSVVDPTNNALTRALGNPVKSKHLSDGSISINGTHVSISHANKMTVAVTYPHVRVAIDLQPAPTHELSEWHLMLGEERFAFAGQLVERGFASMNEALLIAWTTSECLIKLGTKNWELLSGNCTRISTSNIGSVLVFETDRLRIAVATISINGFPSRTTFAIALEKPAFDETLNPAMIENKTNLHVDNKKLHEI